MMLLPTFANFETYPEYTEICRNNSQNIWAIQATLDISHTPFQLPIAGIDTKLSTAKIRNQHREATIFQSLQSAWLTPANTKISSTPNWIHNLVMVKYTIDELQAMVGAKLTGPSDNIHKRHAFSTLWHIQRQLVDGICKVGNVKLTLDGHAGYILSKEAFTLFLSK